MERSFLIDLALDDIIKLNNSSRKRSRPSESVTVAPRFLGSSAPVHPASYIPAPAAPYPYPGPPLMPRMLLPTAVSGGDSGEGTKLYVSNLDYNVSNEDVKKAVDICGSQTTELVEVEIVTLLFSDVGALKRYGIHCDRSGRSMGTAEIVFFHPEDAIAAVRRYNNARLDGRPMKIELVGTIVAPNYCYVEPYRAPAEGQRQLMTTQGHNCNTGWGPQQGDSRRRRFENVKPTAEALDADLERHRLKAMRASNLAEGS